VSFAVLAGAYMTYDKRSWAGATVRRALLAAAGIEIAGELGELGRQAAVDDVLDAAAAAWSAARYQAGEAMCFPDPPEVFSDGCPSAIWA
jgi:predicted RNase H-like nuclease